MVIFKKKDTEKNNSLDNKEITSESTPKIKKRVRIGFGHKPNKEHTQKTPEEINVSEIKDQTDSAQNESHSTENTMQHYENVDLFLDEVTTKDNALKEDILRAETTIEHEWSAAKRKTFAQKDMKGKQVCLEDTGEKIGTVFDTVYDAEKNLIGYKIKDSKSETVLSFPLDQFDEDKNGLIFIPCWYMKGMKTIEKLEFKDRITPELIWLIKDNTVSTEELYSIFIKHDDKIASYIEEAVALRELVDNRLKILEKERLNLKETLMDLTEKRLIKDIDRRQFSEIVMDHRRKVNIIDINIKKCKELIDRLQHTSFGLLSISIASTIEREEKREQHRTVETSKKEHTPIEHPREDPYKQRYFELKDRYDKIQQGYDELKIAVEKLLIKNEV
jgi:sporulation protein YlmC with PRC-barrel domain